MFYKLNTFIKYYLPTFKNIVYTSLYFKKCPVSNATLRSCVKPTMSDTVAVIAITQRVFLKPKCPYTNPLVPRVA
jgi:hypothetical protein